MSGHEGRIWNPIDEEWILSVPGRQGLAPRADLVRNDPRDRPCPFCPGAAEAAVPGRVRAIPSAHPMVTGAQPDPLHWVLVYGESHDKRLSEFPQEMTSAFIEAAASKTAELFDSRNDVQAVFAFESVGDHFGPTIAHPHGQLVGLPFKPRRLAISEPNCTLCGERSPMELTIARTATTTLAVPRWGRFPFEMLSFPLAHHNSLISLSAAERNDLAASVHAALSLATATYGGKRPPYLLNVMQASRGDTSHHLRIEIVPLHKDEHSLKRPGGMELGLGVYLNPMSAVAAAKTLRAALDGGVLT